MLLKKQKNKRKNSTVYINNIFWYSFLHDKSLLTINTKKKEKSFSFEILRFWKIILFLLEKCFFFLLKIFFFLINLKPHMISKKVKFLSWGFLRIVFFLLLRILNDLFVIAGLIASFVAFFIVNVTVFFCRQMDVIAYYFFFVFSL